MKAKSGVIVGVFAACTAVVIGCSSEGSGEAVTSAASAPPAVESPAVESPVEGSPKTTETQQSSTRCEASQLRPELGESSGAAGSVGFPIILTNSSDLVCELDGFPGVSYANGPSDPPVGAPAERTGERGGVVRLAPGESASALVVATVVANFPEADCKPVPVRGLRIYPPNDTGSVYVERDGTACSIAAPVTTQLKIGPVVPGRSGQ